MEAWKKVLWMSNSDWYQGDLRADTANASPRSQRRGTGFLPSAGWMEAPLAGSSSPVRRSFSSLGRFVSTCAAMVVFVFDDDDDDDDDVIADVVMSA